MRGSNPTWNQSLLFDVEDMSGPNQIVGVELWDLTQPQQWQFREEV
jgi:hypothetical protein